MADKQLDGIWAFHLDSAIVKEDSELQRVDLLNAIILIADGGQLLKKALVGCVTPASIHCLELQQNQAVTSVVLHSSCKPSLALLSCRIRITARKHSSWTSQACN